MVDLILIVFTLAVFYAGFYCGAKFSTLGAMFMAARVKVKALF